MRIIISKGAVALLLAGVLGLAGCGNSTTTPPAPAAVAPSGLSVTSASIIEGNTGRSPLIFTVTLNAVSASDVSVNYDTSDGTALAASDYAVSGGTLTIPAGATSGAILVPVNGDVQVEADETFTLTLSAPVNTVLSIATATGTIINDDFTTVSVADATVVEGSTGGSTSLNFTLTLSAASSRDISVTYTASDGTALAASDYTAITASATILAGSTTGTATVLVGADTLFESNETLTLTLSNPRNTALDTAPGAAIATGTILNDDAGGINDTGISRWGNATLNNLTATQPLFPVQDADKGRDSNPTLNSAADGKLGFSFKKLDAAGAPLVNQALTYAAMPWICVSDATTGLTWEVKKPAASGGIHDANNTYTWFNSTGVNDGGNAGTADPGTGATCNSVGKCDTEKFVAAVNVGAGYCGFTDWRMPTREELRSIVDYNGNRPSIDTAYFPNINVLNGLYWTGSPASGGGAWHIVFQSGFGGALFARRRAGHVRLVRGGF